MPRKKKQPIEMTSDELARTLFPQKVINAVKKAVALDSKPSIKDKSK